MFKLKLVTLLFTIKNLFLPFNFAEKHRSGFKVKKGGYKIERLATLPDSVLESSGLEIANEVNKTFWTEGDGGSKSQLFEFDLTGKVVSIYPLKGIRNQDWEEMTKDEHGNIYVCDIGNNDNQRRNLRIYKINVNENNRIDTINFRYPDQLAFPPEKKQANFDCEGVFWYKENLYLISKNRGKRYVKIYKLPDAGGDYVAEVVDRMFINAQITAADISPDRKLVALLAYSKIYFLKVVEDDSLKLKPSFVRKFNQSGQSEALVFINDTDLLITNEEGQVFLMKKKKRRLKD